MVLGETFRPEWKNFLKMLWQYYSNTGKFDQLCIIFWIVYISNSFNIRILYGEFYFIFLKHFYTLTVLKTFFIGLKDYHTFIYAFILRYVIPLWMVVTLSRLYIFCINLFNIILGHLNNILLDFLHLLYVKIFFRFVTLDLLSFWAWLIKRRCISWWAALQPLLCGV